MRAPRGILALYGIDLSFGALAGLSFAATHTLGLERIDLFRLGAESNLPTWYSSAQLLLIALVLGALAWRDARLRDAQTWSAVLPAALFLLLSMDEAAMLHERIGWAYERSAGGEAGLLTKPWLLLVAPVYAVLGVAAFRAAHRYLAGRPDVIRLVLLGGGLFAVSAVGLEAVGAALPTGADMGRRVLGVFEEVGEMVAATTLLWAALRLARHEGLSLQLGEAAPEPSMEDGALVGDGASLHHPRDLAVQSARTEPSPSSAPSRPSRPSRP